MRKAKVFVQANLAGFLIELSNHEYEFRYADDYHGIPVSLTMPLIQKQYQFTNFPSFLEGLLPEGVMLEGLLRKYKLDRTDYFGQIIKVGKDLVGAVSVEEMK